MIIPTITRIRLSCLIRCTTDNNPGRGVKVVILQTLPTGPALGPALGNNRILGCVSERTPLAAGLAIERGGETGERAERIALCNLALNGGAVAYVWQVTVLDVIQRSTGFLAKKGVETPRLQAELLLAHVLQLPRMQLYLNFERVLTETQEDALRQLVKRRGQREPLQHILGETSFCGLAIAVDRRVLIPRPETELLAEQGWLFLNQRSGKPGTNSGSRANAAQPPEAATQKPVAALDFATGSGCVAIALAVNCPTARIVASDISSDALDVARRNAAGHGMDKRIDFILSEGLSGLSRESAFDLIIANPPYVATDEIAGLDPEVREFDPRQALDGGVDGLDFFRRLARDAGAFLSSQGKLMLEFGDGQEERAAGLFKNENWIVERILSDYTQRPRILIATR